ncbi:MAG TPA: HAD family hydrolase [Chloroflexota bacterium]|nr:HAD family hydrolase [Chloroflexota bacterium]
MSAVILWDIDGTLIRSKGGRVSLTAFIVALKQVAQHRTDFAYPTDAGGKTDEQIALEVLALAQIAEHRALELLSDFREAYRIELERQQEALVGDLRVLPGVRETLSALQARGVVQSLLTGNLESIARLKLACVGLDRYVDFELGAFGSDHRDRTCLVPISRNRIRLKTGQAPENVVVIGDTPRDVACARAGGAIAVAVATGLHTREQLEATGADLVLDDLCDGLHQLENLLGVASAIQ